MNGEDHDDVTRLLEWRRAHEGVHVREDEARQLANNNMDARLDKLNELRTLVSEAQGQTMTRNEYNARHDALERRMGAIETAVAAIQSSGQGGLQYRALFITLAVAGLGIFGTLVALIVHSLGG